MTTGAVIFTKNESRSIGRLIDGVSQYMNLSDIFVMDGHSTDGTAAIVTEKGAPIFLDSGRGKGSAIRLALKEIDRDVLVFIDSDGSHRPEEIPSLLEPFYHDNDVVMVIGSRFKGGSEELYGSVHEITRLIGNRLSTFFINLIWRSRLTDAQNGFRAVRRNAILSLGLTEDSFAIEQEMIMKCLKRRMKILEIPSFELKREYNKSHIIPCRMLPKYFMCFMRNMFH